FWFDGHDAMRLTLFERSLVDLELRGQAAASWNLRDGVLDVEIHENLSWVSGSESERSPVPVTAEDWVEASWVLSRAGVGTTAWMERIEATGEHSFTVYFTDPVSRLRLAENYGGIYAPNNAVFWRPWLDDYADATTDEGRQSAVRDAASYRLSSPHPVTNMPFRVDTETGSGWRLTLRDDEPDTPRWVDEQTFDTGEIVVGGVEAQTQAFVDGRLPYAGAVPREEWGGGHRALLAFDESVVDVDTAFETDTLTIPRAASPGCFVMNHAREPAADVHFRRALAYLADRSAMTRRFAEGDEIPTGFMIARDERRFLSADLLSTLRDAPHDNYGYATVDTEAARAELEAGGYEQDSAGQWLHRTGDDAGDPITLDVPAFSGLDELAAAASPFESALTDFGIETSVSVLAPDETWLRFVEGNFTVALGYWGGRLPHDVFATAFVPGWGTYADHGFPATWEGPPVGKTATPPSTATDDTVTYRVHDLVERIRGREQTAVTALSDQLAWVYNQSASHIPMGHLPLVYTVNTRDWDWPMPADEHPAAWSGTPRGHVWQRGRIDAVPR
ncbi:MAG: ABC transporter substrate-binding protein, partial [Halobacteriaceae archaeon]